MRTKHNYYPDDPAKNQACIKFLQSRNRLARRVPPKVGFPCVGGPYDGQVLRLTPDSAEKRSYLGTLVDGRKASTAPFRVGEHHGRYVSSGTTADGNRTVLIWEAA